MKNAFFTVVLIGLISVATMHAHESGSHDHPGASRLKTIHVTTAPDGSVNPWNHLNFHNDPNAFQFAIVSDRTGGHRAGVFEDAIGKLNLLQPEFVVSVGDLIEGYTSDEVEIDRQWDEFDGFIHKLQMPFFYLPGNHDYSNEAMARVWEKRLGRSYYSFVYRDVLFVCLNTQDPIPHHMSEAQTQWLHDTLARHEDARWTLVFLHSPLWTYKDNDKRGWPQVEEALKGRQHTVFAGHVHSYLKRTINNANYYVLATTGGGSRLRGPAYGEFDQVAWITMTKDGPVIANLMLDGILPEDVRTVEGKDLMEQLNTSLMTTDILWQTPGKPLTRQVELRSANPSEFPIDVSISITPAPGIKTDLQHGLVSTSSGGWQFTLQPHSTVALNLMLGGDLPAFSHQASSAALIDWSAKLQPTRNKELQLNGSINLPIVPRLQVPTLTGITIDGDLQDWSVNHWHDVSQSAHLHSKSEGWGGPEDCRFRLSYARDESHLYLAVEVRDEAIISKPTTAPWYQDGIEVRLDFRAPKYHRAAHVSDKGILHLFTSPAPGDGLDLDYVLYKMQFLPAGTRICNRLVPGGYNLEAAFPISSLLEAYGDNWLREGVRFNVSVNDRDNEVHQAQLSWQPDWRVSENIPASGTLFFD